MSEGLQRKNLPESQKRIKPTTFHKLTRCSHPLSYRESHGRKVICYVLHTTTINNVKSALHVDKYNDSKSYFVIAIVISFPVLTSPPTYALLMLDSGVFSSDLGSREYSISTSSKQHNLDVTWDSKLGSDG